MSSVIKLLQLKHQHMINSNLILNCSQSTSVLYCVSCEILSSVAAGSSLSLSNDSWDIIHSGFKWKVQNHIKGMEKTTTTKKTIINISVFYNLG